MRRLGLHFSSFYMEKSLLIKFKKKMLVSDGLMVDSSLDDEITLLIRHLFVKRITEEFSKMILSCFVNLKIGFAGVYGMSGIGKRICVFYAKKIKSNKINVIIIERKNVKVYHLQRLSI